MATVAMDSALPLMNTDNLTSTDTDRVFRKFMASLFLPDVKSSNPISVRNGVLPHNWDTNGCTTLRPQAQSTASMSLDILAGLAVIERSGQGPYYAFTESTKSLLLATSDPSNPRIDTIYAWVGDQSISGNADSSHGPLLGTLTGTPASTPTAPTSGLPDGAIILGYARVNAGASNVPAANVTDARTSTSLTGGVRHLLPGDSVSSAGRIDGEIRFRNAVSPFPALMDYWDSARSLWRGTQEFAITGTLPGSPNAASIVSGSSNTSRTTLVTISIPDPGIPYRLEGSGVVIVNTNSGTANVYMNVNNGPFCSCIVNSGDGARCNLIPVGNNIFTGASTVRLNIDLIGGATSMTWGGDVRNVVTVNIVPA